MWGGRRRPRFKQTSVKHCNAKRAWSLSNRGGRSGDTWWPEAYVWSSGGGARRHRRARRRPTTVFDWLCGVVERLGGSVWGAWGGEVFGALALDAPFCVDGGFEIEDAIKTPVSIVDGLNEAALFQGDRFELFNMRVEALLIGCGGGAVEQDSVLG
jgi:hypothetical protein